MTERLYYTRDDTQAPACVLRCMPEADGRYAVELDRTLFHPQGGGQPADAGWIDETPVEGVVARGDSVAHIVSQPLPLGPVTLCVDASVRQQHARLHSAGHLIGLAGERCGWQPVKAHHWPGEGRITFVPAAQSALPEAQALLAIISAWQLADLPRKVSVEGELRRVGFGDLPAYPCGGTHVARLSDIGEVKISDVKMKKGQMLVHYTLLP